MGIISSNLSSCWDSAFYQEQCARPKSHPNKLVICWDPFGFGYYFTDVDFDNLDNPHGYSMEELAAILAGINKSKILGKDPGFHAARRMVSILWTLIVLVCLGFCVVMKEDLKRLLRVGKTF